MSRTLRTLAALLTYPESDLVAALPEINQHIGSAARLKKPSREALQTLTAYLACGDLLDLQERYVAQFDSGRATSLHLFEHVHGDSRDRGQAMVDLRAMYVRAGLQMTPHELPDYLPAMLEYLSLRERAEMLEMLGDCTHILRSVGERLRDCGSPYQAIFAALLDLAGEAGFNKAKAILPVEKPLDEEWAEEPAFGAPPGACNTAAAQSVIHFMPKA